MDRSVSGGGGGEDVPALPSSVFFQYPIARNAPQGRWSHSASQLGHLMVVYGGVAHAVLDDLQVLDSQTMCWTTVTARAAKPKDRPGQLLGHASAAVGDVVWVFGGQCGRKCQNHLYSLTCSPQSDVFTWQRHANDTLPTARSGHSMATVHESVYLFGGQGKKLYNDLHKLEGAAGSFSEVVARGKPPTPRHGQSMAWDGLDLLVVFGGLTAGSVDNTLSVFSLSRSEWTSPQCFGTAPSARSEHSSVMLSPGVLLFFGGCNTTGQFYGMSRWWRVVSLLLNHYQRLLCVCVQVQATLLSLTPARSSGTRPPSSTLARRPATSTPAA